MFLGEMSVSNGRFCRTNLGWEWYKAIIILSATRRIDSEGWFSADAPNSTKSRAVSPLQSIKNKVIEDAISQLRAILLTSM